VDGISRQHNLLRDEHAKTAHHLVALRLGVLKLLDPQAMHLGQHEVKVFHAPQAARLAEINISVELAEDLQQSRVSIQV
jgi:hypothetical protein